MTLVLGFGPFILFAIFSRLSADLALWLAFAAAFVVTIRDFVERPALRLLDATSLCLFGLLSLWRGFLEPGLSLAALRLLVDLGLAVPILVSLLSGRPFSRAYAGGEGWSQAQFLKVNYAVSLAWLAAFAAMTLADGAVIAFGAPLWAAIATSLVAPGLAIAFTLRVPARRQRR